MTDFAGIADVLERAATAMDTNPALDPDGAVRLAVWGDPEASYPDDDNSPGCDLYDEASSAIECFCGYQGNGIQDIPRRDAIEAARAEAERFRSYVGGT